MGTDFFRAGLTRDLATFIGCHEVGHALGGFPFKDAACADGPGARPRCWFRPNSKPYDCSSVPEGGDCVVTDEGVSTQRVCTARMGIELFPCSAGTRCKLDEDGFPACELDTN